MFWFLAGAKPLVVRFQSDAGQGKVPAVDTLSPLPTELASSTALGGGWLGAGIPRPAPSTTSESDNVRPASNNLISPLNGWVTAVAALCEIEYTWKFRVGMNASTRH